MAVSSSVRLWHRRIALLVGIQLFAWTLSGFIFTWHPIEEVRGETFLTEVPPPANAPPSRAITAAAAARKAGISNLTEARLTWLRDRWVWLIASPTTVQPVAIDAVVGEALPPLDAQEASAIAQDRFIPDAQVIATLRVTEAVGEYRDKPVPAWRVQMNDSENTALYIVEDTGEVGSVRNDMWRRFDFLWMLHIMDYADRKNFSTPWLKIVAALGLGTSLSGLWLGWIVLLGNRRKKQT